MAHSFPTRRSSDLALRAFTAADRKTIKKAAENYPESVYYDVDELMTQLGTGEAFVTMLNEKGIPTPLVHTMLIPPSSRMDILSDSELNDLASRSKLISRYNRVVDAESAYEILNAKLAEASSGGETGKDDTARGTSKEAKKSTLETILSNSVTRQIGRTAASIVTRSLLGALGLGGRSKTKKWF